MTKDLIKWLNLYITKPEMKVLFIPNEGGGGGATIPC